MHLKRKVVQGERDQRDKKWKEEENKEKEKDEKEVVIRGADRCRRA